MPAKRGLLLPDFFKENSGELFAQDLLAFKVFYAKILLAAKSASLHLQNSANGTFVYTV
jgi:hypothetical protein